MKVKEDNIEFKLVNIEILESEIKAPLKPLAKNANFSFNIALEQRFNIEKELIFVICDVTVFPDNNSNLKLGKYRSSCIFKVNDLSNYITNEKDISLPDVFMITLNTISISTTRGLMFSLFKGTFLQRALLPIVDPNLQKESETI